MRYKDDWAAARLKWSDYWKHENKGRPLMHVVARKPEIEDAWRTAKAQGHKLFEHICQGEDPTLPPELICRDMDDRYRDAKRMVERYRHFCENHLFLAEAFPNINVDFGPGSLAAYQGCDITFREDTVWFDHCCEDLESFHPITFDPENKWWKCHYGLVKEIRELAGEDFYIGMPDLMENIDVLASIRGTEDMIYDTVDYPEEVAERIRQVGDCYFDYYDRFYDLVKNEADGGSCYTVFQIWGPGKTAKLQCDFAAMLSPDSFREFIQESLRQQAKKLDTVLYHLDGPDCIRHLDAIMEIDEIDALQWTSGDYGPDGTLPDWDVIYDKARAAGKSLWVKVYSGEFEDWIRNSDRIVERYGSHSLFLHYPEMSETQARQLLDHADRHWKDVEGAFRP